ncbi:MAG: 30S ribosomal protein S9 [Planctomycetota bacterium]
MSETGFQTTITNPDLAGENLMPEAAPEQEVRAVPDPIPADKHGWWWGVGRRKSAVARVRLRPAKEGEGKGVVHVQITRKKFKTIEEYLSGPRDRTDAYAPLELTGLKGDLDVFIRCTGGGTTGQAQAIRLGIARALVGFDPNHEKALRDAGFLSRDARKVERKKYGQPGARRRFQFSKR